jgi:all-trans-retinol 13,14-reductase
LAGTVCLRPPLCSPAGTEKIETSPSSLMTLLHPIACSYSDIPNDPRTRKMRMGKLSKHERIGKSYPQQKPKFSSPGLIVGHVSSNVINSVLTPLMEGLATQSLETYSDLYVEYQDALKLATNGTEAEIDADGTTQTHVIFPEPPKEPFFHSQSVIDEVKEIFDETAKHFSTLKKYKVYAKAAKFERHLDERYGIFKPFITNNPQIEHFVKSLQRKYELGNFSPIRQQQGPISKSTAIIVLFMMQRNGVQWQAMVLGVLFLLVGLQPWALVLCIVIANGLVGRRKIRALGTMKKQIGAVEPYYKTKGGDGSDEYKQSLLKQPVGTKMSNNGIVMSEYNTIILGSGPGALYTAALLAKAGRKVLVLSPEDDASGCATMAKYPDMPFDIQNNSISRIRRQQEILAPALCTSTDYQGGIRFAQIGSQEDGHAFEILTISGMGGDGAPFVLRADGGTSGFMNDTASFLGDGWPGYDGSIGNNLAGAYLTACQGMNSGASEYYLSKVLSDKVNDLRSKSTYSEVSIRHTSSFLDQIFPMNAHLRSLMAGIGMKGENVKPSQTSMGAHVTNVCAAMSGEGMHYPIGGPRALCHALASVVEQCGGKVVTGANVTKLIFDEEEKPPVEIKAGKSEDTDTLRHPRCIGVALQDGEVLTFSNVESNADNCVVSCKSFIDTFIRYLPEHIRDEYKVPRGLPALSERRPHIKVIFALKGSAEDLEVTGADFYRLPSAGLPVDELDPMTGAVTLGQVGGTDRTDENKNEDMIFSEEINAPVAESTAEATGPKKKTRRNNKFYTGESWMQISFPSAKDPTFAARHGSMTTCVVTIEADDDFVLFFDTKPKIYSVLRTGSNSDAIARLMDRVKKDLLANFPQLEGKIDHSELRGPFVQGLSHNPERYAAKGIRADTPYPGLYMGSSDLTVGDSFSGSIVAGWLAANAVVGYSAVDYLFLEKNVTSDLEQFMDLPDVPDEECVAVPYSLLPAKDQEVTQDAGEEVAQ